VAGEQEARIRARHFGALVEVAIITVASFEIVQETLGVWGVAVRARSGGKGEPHEVDSL
jgi:hypothetical protein